MISTLKQHHSLQASNVIEALTADAFKDRTNFRDYTLNSNDLIIINSLSDIIPETVSFGIRYGFNDMSELAHRNMSKSPLNGRPVIALLYYLALNHKQQLLTKYPFALGDLITVFTQLGISSGIQNN